MPGDISEQITSLKDQPLETLKDRYKELFAISEAPSNNKVFLWRKIAYRLQEQAYGGLSQKAKDKIALLIQEYDPINNKALRPEVISAGKEVVALPCFKGQAPANPRLINL